VGAGARAHRTVAAGLVAGLVLAGLVALGAGWWSASAERQAVRLPRAVLAGAPVTAADLRGGPAIVHYWASWCLPCRQEAPELAALERALAGSRARLVGVAVADRATAARAFLRRAGWSFPVLADPEGRTGTAGLPLTLVLDARGRIAERRYGPQTARGLLRAVARLS
jgi:cytochrome c biogenesis protein CcmG/thiol:disulfide interchange protein DsbE